VGGGGNRWGLKLALGLMSAGGTNIINIFSYM